MLVSEFKPFDHPFADGFSWPAGQDQKNKEVDLARFTGQVFSKCKCKLWERRNARSACIHTPEKTFQRMLVIRGVASNQKDVEGNV